MANDFGAWQYQTTNVEGDMDNVENYTRGDRTILFSRKSKTSDTFKPIGLIQGFTHSEQKQLQMLFELGSAAPIIIPGLATGQISINRVLLSGPDFMNVIYGVEKETSNQKFIKSLRDINTAFDLMIAKYPVKTPKGTQEASPEKALSYVVFEGCQIQGRSESVSPGGVITVENLSIMYKQISTASFTPSDKVYKAPATQ